MDKTCINELNALLKGEHMAIDGYEKYIQSTGEPNIKGELQKIQQDHKMHAIKISERIQSLGGRPVDGVGVMGRVAETVSNIKDIGIGNRDSATILRDAYTGENNGINMANELVKGDLDTDSMNLVNGILNEDRNHLNTLDNMIKTVQ